MREYISQFYNEGFATTFYLRPIKYFEKRIKNKKILDVVSILIKLLYTVFVIAFGIFMFFRKFPL